MQLGQLKKIPLRDAWSHEATDFTNWLAQPENLQLLSDEIGIDISLIETEASVGKFNVDIRAEEENTGRQIVIENQLESTDHDHLGKIITYASGFDAEIIIWIVKDVRDEHKQAIDWLNENTNAKINFFAINIELWRIGDSPYAPKFNVISKPNNWAKALKKSGSTTSTGKITDLKMLQLEFWTSFNEFVAQSDSSIRTRTPRPQHWYDLSLGVGQRAHISLTVHSREKYCSAEIYIPNDRDLFFKLEEQKEQIQNQCGLTFKWMELPNKQASRIIIKKYDFDLNDTDSWQNQYKWLLESIETMKPVFSNIIKKLSNK